MSLDSSAPRHAGRRTLLALAALFLLPLALAFCAYYGSAWRPAHRLNHGVLLSPARPLPATRLPLLLPGSGTGTAGALPLRERWSLLYVGGGDCDAACLHALYLMRQTRLALANDMPRVARVFLATSDCRACGTIAREDPGLTVLGAEGAGAQRLLEEFPAPAREHELFVVDPLGNLVMSYDVDADPHGLLEDLEKLLMLSHIG